jgi:hypothetical protein
LGRRRKRLALQSSPLVLEQLLSVMLALAQEQVLSPGSSKCGCDCPGTGCPATDH